MDTDVAPADVPPGVRPALLRGTDNLKGRGPVPHRAPPSKRSWRDVRTSTTMTPSASSSSGTSGLSMSITGNDTKSQLDFHSVGSSMLVGDTLGRGDRIPLEHEGARSAGNRRCRARAGKRHGYVSRQLP